MRFKRGTLVTFLRVTYAKTAYRVPGVRNILEGIRIARAQRERKKELERLEHLRRRGESLVHLLHIGKTGGTAVKEALADYTTSGPHVVALHLHHYKLKDVPRGEFVVFFLRDPISRFVSGFLNQQRQGLPRYLSAWTPGERAALERFSTPNELALALSAPVSEERLAAESAMRSIKHVRSGLWGWFGDPDYFMSRADDILFVGFQERLTEDFDRLKEILQLPKTVQLPSGAESNKTPRADKHLDDNARINLRKWYAADYKFIELCASIMSLELPPSLKAEMPRNVH